MAASSNISDVGAHTTTAVIAAPTQAGEGAIMCSGVAHPDDDYLFSARSLIRLVFIY